MSVETKDMSGEWVMFMVGNWKPHWCPAFMLAGLMEDATRRGQGLGTSEPSPGGIVDQPGMILQNRTYQKFDLGMFVLKIPTEDCEHYREVLEENRVRKFADGREYYKVHGWIHCVVLAPEHRKIILDQMKRDWDKILATAKSERETFRSAIDKINEGGTKVMSFKAPNSIPKKPLSGKPNKHKN